MEYIDGESLISVIDRIGIQGMLGWRQDWRVATHVGSALAEAYNQQIIHRNLTPTNIMRRHRDKSCVLGDRMLAKGLQGALAQQVTQPRQLIGNVSYMAPERVADTSSLSDHLLAWRVLECEAFVGG